MMFEHLSDLACACGCSKQVDAAGVDGSEVHEFGTRLAWVNCCRLSCSRKHLCLSVLTRVLFEMFSTVDITG